MAKLRDFTVSLNPAKRTDSGSVRITYSLCEPSPCRNFQATTTEEVIAQAAAFAKEHGKPCAAYIRCLSKPKPPGFDAKTRALYFNLD